MENRKIYFYYGGREKYDIQIFDRPQETLYVCMYCIYITNR